MMIPFKDILYKYNISPNGVIQVGAHWAEEHDDYVKCGVDKFVYVEPCFNSFIKMVDNFESKYPNEENNNTKLSKFINDNCISAYAINRNKNDSLISVIFLNYACGKEEMNMPMYVSHQNQGQSNSLLEPSLHLEQHPEIKFEDAEVVKVNRLDSLVIKHIHHPASTGILGDNFNILVMDVQGYEGEVLRGAVQTLPHMDMIYTEVNRGETYKGNMLIEEMDEFLDGFDFKRVETYWPSPNWTWGDAVYVSKRLLNA